MVQSRSLAGVVAPRVTVEVHIAGGLPGVSVVGLPDAEVREARDRVRAALQNSRFEFPARKVTVSLAPADLRKESGRFDLPIALGILAATGQIPSNQLPQYEFAGELALTGDLRPVRGALAMARSAQGDGHAFVLPAASAGEAALVRDATIFGAPSLLAVCAHLAGSAPLVQAVPDISVPQHSGPDIADVRGQAQAKRVLEIAAAGAHSLLNECTRDPVPRAPRGKPAVVVRGEVCARRRQTGPRTFAAESPAGVHSSSARPAARYTDCTSASCSSVRSGGCPS